MAYRLKGVDVNTMNQAILKRLKTNSRMSWQQIGKEVHLTGQAVAARVQQMQDDGVIGGATSDYRVYGAA
jgi:Lrp/AsnC family leucine-responsive transcriptional regulator